MRSIRAAALLTLILLAASPHPARSQERRDSTRRAVATSAEEMHRMRRAWLEQRRLGRLDAGPAMFGSAVVGAPRTGYATGIGAPLGGYGNPYRSPYGLPYGGNSSGCGAPSFAGYPGYGTGWAPFVPGAFGGGYPGLAMGWAPFAHGTFGGGCAPFGPRQFGAPRAPFFGTPGTAGLPYPAYPPYGRFYDRFNPDVRGRYGSLDPLLFGVQEYGHGWYGPWRSYPGPIGWSGGAYGWYSAPPWSGAPSDCVDLTLQMANGRAHTVMVGLQSLGLADPRDLDLAIDARLSEGRPVVLQGLDGRVLRIEPGSPIDDILVRPCGG